MRQTGKLSLVWHPQPQPQWTLLPAVAGMKLPLKVLFCRSTGFRHGYVRSQCRAWGLTWVRASKKRWNFLGGLQVFTSSCSGVGLRGRAVHRGRCKALTEKESKEKGRKEKGRKEKGSKKKGRTDILSRVKIRSRRSNPQSLLKSAVAVIRLAFPLLADSLPSKSQSAHTLASKPKSKMLLMLLPSSPWSFVYRQLVCCYRVWSCLWLVGVLGLLLLGRHEWWGLPWVSVFGWLVGGLVGCLVDRLVGGLVGCLVNRLVGGLVGCLVTALLASTRGGPCRELVDWLVTALLASTRGGLCNLLLQ